MGNRQLNHRLLTLTQAAVPSLEPVRNQDLPSLNRGLPWRQLFNGNQSLEWFNTEGKLLARKGTIFSTLPLNKTSHSQTYEQQGQIRTLTIAIYAHNPNPKNLQLEGYIRASETTKETEAIVKKLSFGLGLGGAIALIFRFIFQFAR